MGVTMADQIDDKLDQLIEQGQHRRALFPEISAYFDPSNVEYKPMHQIAFPVHHGMASELEGEPRPLNILSIGSEHTSGATLSNQYDAYPYLIGHPFHNHVDSLSFRPSSADFPSMCLESISVRGDYRAGYDLILLDFNLNGSDGLPLLVKRLRDRYPDAVLVYVGLWSLMTSMEEVGTGKSILQVGHDTTRDWKWKDEDFYVTGDLISKHNMDCTHEICTLDKLKSVMETYGGYVYEFPRPSSPEVCIREGWFNEHDWHHLSETGHRVLANDLIRFLSDKYDALFNNLKVVNEWDMGDQCYNWMATGNNPLEYSGAEMKDMLADAGTDVSRWALTFDAKGEEDGEIIVDSKFDVPVPAGIAYFSRPDPANIHIMNISINGESPAPIDPSSNKSGVHMTGVTMLTYAHIGNVQPGKNVIKITTKEKKQAPFQVSGLYLCGACAELGHLGQGAANYLNPAE
jgi:hypothetical protein